MLLDSDENNLLSLISDGKDLLYVGTDPNGLVYRVNRKTGESFVLFDAPEAEISGAGAGREGEPVRRRPPRRATSSPACPDDRRRGREGGPAGGDGRGADPVAAAEGARAAGGAGPEPGQAGPDSEGGPANPTRSGHRVARTR